MFDTMSCIGLSPLLLEESGDKLLGSTHFYSAFATADMFVCVQPKFQIDYKLKVIGGSTGGIPGLGDMIEVSARSRDLCCESYTNHAGSFNCCFKDCLHPTLHCEFGLEKICILFHCLIWFLFLCLI